MPEEISGDTSGAMRKIYCEELILQQNLYCGQVWQEYERLLNIAAAWSTWNTLYK